MSHPDEPGERCAFTTLLRCHNLATHKVGEDASLFMHEMTTYLCCDHMKMIGMDCSCYPYALAMTDPFPTRRTLE